MLLLTLIDVVHLCVCGLCHVLNVYIVFMCVDIRMWSYVVVLLTCWVVSVMLIV